MTNKVNVIKRILKGPGTRNLKNVKNVTDLPQEGSTTFRIVWFLRKRGGGVGFTCAALHVVLYQQSLMSALD